MLDPGRGSGPAIRLGAPRRRPTTNHLNAVSWEASGYDSAGRHENTVTTSGAVSVTIRTCSPIRARSCGRHIRPPLSSKSRYSGRAAEGMVARAGGCGPFSPRRAGWPPDRGWPGSAARRPPCDGQRRGQRGDLEHLTSTSAWMSRSWPRRCPPCRRLFDPFTLVRLVSCPPRHIRCNSRSCCVGSDGK
jgi:hypothetical protein